MSRVACETAAALTDADAVQLCGAGGAGCAGSASPRADDDADGPPDSVLLRVPDGVGLTHLLFGAAAALRRDRSTKGSSNPKAAAEAEAATRKGAPRAAATTTAASSSKTAAVVVGVLAASKVAVAKERRARAPGPGRASSWRRPSAAAGGARVFASEAVGPEPVSPKVSCLGAVLPERSAAAAPQPAGTTQEEEEEQGRSGCWASLLHLRTAFLGLCCGDNNNELSSAASEPTPTPKAAAAAQPEPQRVAANVMSPPRPPVAVAGLGDVKRLASRRWGNETMAAPASTV